ncbi:hypothetical protein ERJ75_000087100 [Trypanosoma vivax]|nr:hypothetical protein ERJ75_000087100 [Trypanosoma vivax]
MVLFELSKSGDFIPAFEAAKECFQNEWPALEGRSVLFRQYEEARLQIHEERQSMQAHFAAADGENNDLRQRVCQPQEQNQHMVEHTKSLQDANGALAAEDVFLKAGSVHAAMETRRAMAERSEPNAQLPQQWAGTIFHAPAAGKQQQYNNSPLTTNVGLRGVQVMRDKLSEASFKTEENICTHEGALDYWMAALPEHLFAACRDMFPTPPKLGFCSKTHGMKWCYVTGSRQYGPHG